MIVLFKYIPWGINVCRGCKKAEIQTGIAENFKENSKERQNIGRFLLSGQYLKDFRINNSVIGSDPWAKDPYGLIHTSIP
jgi:hypothetical protein